VIQQAVDAIHGAIDAHIREALATMPGGSVVSGLTTVVSRNTITEADIGRAAVRVQVEQQDAVTEPETMEGLEELPEISIGVTCTIVRSKVPALKGATDDELCRVIRQVARAVGYSIRRGFRLGVIDSEGAQIRTPRGITYGEPETGDDAELIVMTLSLSVPVVDYWALSAGSL
jgi:hypothetical protein